MVKLKNLGDKVGQRRVSLSRDIGDVKRGIMITENNSGLGKRYVAKQYKDGKLIASFPGNTLSEIDLTYFVK